MWIAGDGGRLRQWTSGVHWCKVCDAAVQSAPRRLPQKYLISEITLQWLSVKPIWSLMLIQATTLFTDLSDQIRSEFDFSVWATSIFFWLSILWSSAYFPTRQRHLLLVNGSPAQWIAERFHFQLILQLRQIVCRYLCPFGPRNLLKVTTFLKHTIFTYCIGMSFLILLRSQWFIHRNRLV